MITGLLAYANILNGRIKHVANSIPATKEKGGSFKDQSFFSEVFVNFFFPERCANMNAENSNREQ